MLKLPVLDNNATYSQLEVDNKKEEQKKVPSNLIP